MRRVFSWWAVLVAALFILVSPLAARETLQETVRIASWPDGDTATLQDGRRIRLVGVDTPEMAKADQPAGYFAREARACARRLTKGVSVRILFLEDAEDPGKRLRDRYGRLLGEVLLPDGRSLNEHLLREGMGFYYPHEDIPHSMRERLLAAQNLALKNRAGCWRAVLTLPEATAAYVGNQKSKRFFSKSCLAQIRVARYNQISFPNLEAAFAAGYAPARPCGIWPAASALPKGQKPR